MHPFPLGADSASTITCDPFSRAYGSDDDALTRSLIVIGHGLLSELDLEIM